MKKCLQTLLFTCLWASVGFSQTQFSIGLRAGVNSSNYKVKYGASVVDSARVQFQNVSFPTIGIPFEMNFSNNFTLQIEVNFTQKGYKIHIPNTSPRDKSQNSNVPFKGYYQLVNNWLEIPILAKLTFKPTSALRFGIFFGPSFNYSLDYLNIVTLDMQYLSNPTLANNPYIASPFMGADLNGDIDVCLNLGGELNFKRFFMDARYQSGVIDMRINGDIETETNGLRSHSYTRNFALTAGYRFTLGKGIKTSKK
jgi:hypothetical protein